MKTVFFLTKSLYLYSDTGWISSTLKKSKNFSEQDLINAIPTGELLTVYYNQVDAVNQVRKERKMVLVEDDNKKNTIGQTYRSIHTPVILELQLNKEIHQVNNGKFCEIDWGFLDLTKAINVINVEKGYNGTMPVTIMITEAELPHLRSNPSSCTLI